MGTQSLPNLVAEHELMRTSHVAEEIENAAVVIPKSLLAALLLNGSLGFGMLTALLFCMGDPDDILNSSFGLPFIDVFNGITNSVSGATAMASLSMRSRVPVEAR